MAFGGPEPTFSSLGLGSTTRRRIVGCAYGYEHPKHGPLGAGEFNGGESSVEALLTRRGFKVVPDVSALLHPSHLISWAERGQVPNKKGVYAWYFKKAPPGVPVAGCRKHDGCGLLYVGIAPDKRLKGVKPPQERLRKRIGSHFAGNAEASNLRLALGCLLAGRLQLELRRVGSGKRQTFVKGEVKLSKWMESNAFVAWIEHPQPWTVEKYLIHTLIPPLNLKDNPANPFRPKLKKLLKDARANADKRSVVK